MPFSTYMDNAILNEFYGGTNYVPPATVYVGLSTTAPTKAGGSITEPTGGAYARVAVTNNATNFPNATTGSKSNGSVITFAEATASWGTPSHWAIFDALTGGNMLTSGTITTPKVIDIADTPSFAVGTLTISLT